MNFIHRKSDAFGLFEEEVELLLLELSPTAEEDFDVDGKFKRLSVMVSRFMLTAEVDDSALDGVLIKGVFGVIFEELERTELEIRSLALRLLLDPGVAPPFLIGDGV